MISVKKSNGCSHKSVCRSNTLYIAFTLIRICVPILFGIICDLSGCINKCDMMRPMADCLHYPRDTYFPKRLRPVHWDVFGQNAWINLDRMWQGSLEELFNLGHPSMHATRKNYDNSVFLPHLPQAVIVQLGKVWLRKHICLDFIRLLLRDTWALHLSVGLTVRVKFGPRRAKEEIPCVVCWFAMISNSIVYDKTKTKLFSESKSFWYKNEARHVRVSPLHLVSLRSTG